MEYEFSIGGLVVLAAMLLGRWLFSRLDPKTRKLWYPRMALAVMVVVSPVFLAVALSLKSWLALPILAFFAFFIHASAIKTRICERCGATIQPLYLVAAADYCPRCGAELSRARIFSSRPS